MMRLAITGRHGQVTKAVQERVVGKDVDVIILARPRYDLSDRASIKDAVASIGADIIVSAAAYTAVDRAESEPEIAYSINAAGIAALGEAASTAGIPVIHLSTDYVFSGEKHEPYIETDGTDPQNVYGLTKLAGEQLLSECASDHVILRTAWVYSPFGANFVKTMLKLAQSRDQIRVVADQFGSPTSALDIANALLRIARRFLDQPNNPELTGIFHLTAAGETTWAAFAEAVFDISAQFGGPAAKVTPIPSTEYTTPAKRPRNSRLCSEKLRSVYNIALPDWRLSLVDTVRRLIDDESF